MGKPHPDDDTRVQALIFAAVHGDPAAAQRFGFTTRALRKWRAEVREGDTELSETFRLYGRALTPEVRASDFTGWMQRQVMRLLDVFIEKAEHVNPNQPQGLLAIVEMTSTLLDHLSALTFLAYRFGDGPDGHRSEDDRHGAVTPDRQLPARTSGARLPRPSTRPPAR